MLWAGGRSGQGRRADLLLPQQPPGRAAPGGGALMGARRRAGDPGLPPAQDSEGERVLRVEGWMEMVKASEQVLPLRLRPLLLVLSGVSIAGASCCPSPALR